MNAPTQISFPLRLAVLAAAVLGLLGPAASSASAQVSSPWWNLSSVSRPSRIDPGVAADAEQTLTVTATGGTFKLRREENLASGEKETTALPFNVTHAALQAALEGIYGAGNVEVTGGPGNATGSHPYTIGFRGALADQPIFPLSVFPSLAGPGKQAKIEAPQPGRPDAELSVTAINLGTADADGTTVPIEIADTLPPGLHAVGILAVAPGPGGSEPAAFPCVLATLTCTFEGNIVPYDKLEVRIDVVAEPGFSSGGENHVTISGGGARGSQISRPLPLVSAPGEPTPFGLAENELSPEKTSGSASSAAATHPFQVTSTLVLNQGPDLASLHEKPLTEPAGMAKDVNVKLPPGLVGNPSPLPQCAIGAFLTKVEDATTAGNACPADTAIGVATLDINEPAILKGFHTFTAPVFNLEPAFGEPARFGFYIAIASQPVLLDASLRDRSGEDYGITVSSLNTPQTVGFIDSSVTLWGTPGDPSHDASRGWGCLAATRGEATTLPCEGSNALQTPAFQTLPTRCEGPLVSSTAINSWLEPATLLEAPTTASMPTLELCNQVPFNPAVGGQPTSNAATSGTGFDFNLDFGNEGLLNSNERARAESEVKKAVVTLPEGFTANPSVAAELKACNEAEYEASTVEMGTGCTEESKIGSVEIESPLVTPRLKGSLYIAKQNENPYGNLLTIYLVAQNPELGIVIKQALKVTPNPVTGQLTTEVDEIPQLPFSRFHLQFRSGQRSPLITPPACGTYAVKAELYPYSDPESPVERESSFQITGGPEDQPCPSGGLPPFHPGLEAGTVNNAAGSYSPFYVHMTRKDSEQEITHFSIKLPPGVVGKLAGVQQCSDAAIAAAKAREHEGGGEEELDNPSCPAGSEVGHTLVGTGVGNVLAYAPGKVYLAGPYHGSPISIVAITAAKVGPFDLGTVVVREALRVNPETAEVFVDATGSDPIPHIVDGIPVHLRDIRVYVNRPEFVLNPTSCEPTSTASTLLGAGLDFASEEDDNPVTVSSRFQAADCAALGFKPKLSFKLKGGTKRSQYPAVTAVAEARPGDANIGRAEVILPKSEILAQEHIGTSCTRVQFNAGAGNGAGCPPNSIYGRARAVTPLLSEALEGPVYLRSNGGERNVPDLVAALHGQEINVDLVGFVDSVLTKNKHGETVSRIRNRFQNVPDAPVSKFTLELFGGKKGLLVNTTNLCTRTHKAEVSFTAHNGKREELTPALKTSCAKKHKGKKHARR